MFWIDILLAFIVALVLSFLLVAVLGWQRSDGGAVLASFLFVFALLFLATWAGAIWLEDFGPTAWGVFWLPFIIVGVVFMLVLAAAAPGWRRPRRRRQALQQAENAREAQVALDIFFWIAIIALIISILVYYY